MVGSWKRATAWGAAGLVAWGAGMGEATAAVPPLEARADEAGRLFRDDAPKLEDLFAPEFLKAVPPAQIAALVKQMRGQVGDFARSRRLGGGDETHGTFEYTFSKGYTVKADLAVAEQAPHKITGLLLGNPTPLAGSLADVAKAIAALPGRTTFAVFKLPEGRPPEARVVHEPDRALAIGSAFKLWILGALVEDVAAKKRRWSDVVALEAAAVSLPSSRLRDWPVGSPLTLHTLAGAMISESDNTATDQLLRTLGRGRVEAAMAAMGVREPARNRPMLSTLEMFKIKAGPIHGAAETWAGMDEGHRRTYLDGTVAKIPADAVKSWSEPRALDSLEWFASAADLARTMAWLRDRSGSGEAGKARGVLAINPGIRLDKAAWPYVGYKGGSEPGVVAAAFLLRGSDGRWWAITGAWNDPKAAVDTGKFFGLLERAADLAAAERGPLESAPAPHEGPAKPEPKNR